MVARGAPIVAGPWLGEVGFELLYWVPFLRWFAERFDVDPDRLIVMSRGGTASWYRPFASRYVDVFDEVTPTRFAISTTRGFGCSASRSRRVSAISTSD